LEKKLYKGNYAVAEAAVMAGCRYYFGYPITPQNEISEYLSWRLPEVEGVFIQAESEVSAINMVYGSAAAGARVMTSSSGLGIALKQEGIANLCGAEVPAVIVNISRGGPGLGSIGPAQSDYHQMTRGGGPGDYNMIVFAPSTVQEMVDLVQLSFDKADQYRNPVAIYADGTLGQMMASACIEEKKPDPNLPPKDWAVRGRDDSSRPKTTLSSLVIQTDELEAHNMRLQEKFKKIQENETRVECQDTDDADIIIVAYGTCAKIAAATKRIAEKNGLKVGIVRPITLWPFPYKDLFNAAQNAKAVLCLEMAAGQMLDDVKIGLSGSKPVDLYYRLGGNIPKTKDVYEKIVSMMQEVR
jgi:2-oxoglutarate ferredoxin oxidoreductase subunit alpha